MVGPRVIVSFLENPGWGTCEDVNLRNFCWCNDGTSFASAKRGRVHVQARRQREKLAGIFGSHSSTRRQPSQAQAAHASSAPSQSDHRPDAPQNGQPLSQGLKSEPQDVAAGGRGALENGKVPLASAVGNSHSSGTSQDSSLDSDESLDLGETLMDGCNTTCTPEVMPCSLELQPVDPTSTPHVSKIYVWESTGSCCRCQQCCWWARINA